MAMWELTRTTPLDAFKSRHSNNDGGRARVWHSSAGFARRYSQLVLVAYRVRGASRRETPFGADPGNSGYQPPTRSAR